MSTAVLTDSFNRLGNAKRLINSKSFKDMRTAAENAIKRDGTPEQVAERDKEAIDAADNYIRTHKSPRRTKTGRERFNQALRILGAKMEPDTFIDYVKQLNQDRGVTDKNSEHYLNADEFIYTSQERELAEARKNLNQEDWEAPSTQMMKIVAAYEIVNHKKDAKEGDDQLISVAELNKKAKNKWDDSLFREWFSKKGQENIKKALKDNPNEIYNYKDDLKKVREEYDRKKAEEQKRKEIEEQKRKEIEEQKRKEIEEQERKEAEEQKRKEKLKRVVEVRWLKKNKPVLYNDMQKAYLAWDTLAQRAYIEKPPKEQIKKRQAEIDKWHEIYRDKEREAREALKDVDMEKEIQNYQRIKEKKEKRDSLLMDHDPELYNAIKKYKKDVKQAKEYLQFQTPGVTMWQPEFERLNAALGELEEKYSQLKNQRAERIQEIQNELKGENPQKTEQKNGPDQEQPKPTEQKKRADQDKNKTVQDNEPRL